MTSANPQTKPYMVSISGKTLADNLIMLKKISDVMMEQQQSSKEEVQIAAVELNLACPNIVGKPTIGYDFDQMDMVLEAVSSLPCVSSYILFLFCLFVWVISLQLYIYQLNQTIINILICTNSKN